MKKLSLVLCIVSLFFVAGCGGGSSNSSDDGGGSSKTTAEQLETAKTFLKSGDIASARSTYSAIIGSESAIMVSKAPDPDNSEARFGRALCDIMLLIEKAPFTAILAGFGQSQWLTSSVFGPSGYLALSLTDPHPVYPSLPFYNVKDCWHSEKMKGHSGLRCALSRVIAGYTAEQIAASLNELTGYVDPIIEDLLVAVDTASASFTIPKELYSGDADIPINHADMVQILAGMYMLKAGSDFANSWGFDIDLSTLVDENGNALITRADMVNQLNQQFALRSDNRITNARANMQQAVAYSKSSIQEVLNGSTGGVLNLSSENQIIYTDLQNLIASTNDSFGGAVQMDEFLPIVETNLDKFFNNPADGAAIASDPFVLQFGRIKAVEAYWQPMISTACDYNIHTAIKIFSATTRAVDRPYYQLFKVIIGHKFGAHQAGPGA